MRPLDLNLASRPFRNNTLVWLAYVALLAATVWFTYWNVSSFRHYRAELAKLDHIQGNMEQEQGDLIARHKSILRGVSGFDRVSIDRRTSKANQVIEWKAFSWTRLFNQLEDLLPWKIRLTSIRPIFRERDRDAAEADTRLYMPITVEGMARDWEAIFELETDLMQDESFGRVLPRQIAKAENGELSFAIEFRYYPDEPSRDETSGDEVAEAQPDGAADDEPAAAGSAGPRELPAADPPAGEVTDEWAERVESADSGPAPESAESKEPASRKPARRALPKVEPEPAPSDDGGASR